MVNKDKNNDKPGPEKVGKTVLLMMTTKCYSLISLKTARTVCNINDLIC